MTREILNRYPDLCRQSQLLRRELEEMTTTEEGLGHSIVMDYRTGFPRPQAVVGFDEERYEKKRRQLDEKEALIREILDWIDAIDDVVTRQVFRLYYLDGCSWVEVAKRIGYRGNPDYPRLMIRDKYLRSKGLLKK